MASHNKPFSIVLLEALKYSKPAVTTTAQGPLEFVMNQENALLIPTNNPFEFAQAIEKLLNNAGLSAKIAQNAHLRIQDFPWPKVAKLIKDTINSIIKINIKTNIKTK